MRKAAFLLLAALTASVAAAGEIRGTWSALAEGDKVVLTMIRGRSDWSRSLPRSDFALSDAQINAASETPVHFAIRRDAGSIDLTGTFEHCEGAGHFTFTSNPSYAASLRALSVESKEALDDEKLFSLAMHDISLAFIREMQSLGYREDVGGYVRFRIHGVTPDFVRDLRALGYETLSAEDLVRFRIHGVTSEYIQELKALGYTLVTSGDLVRMRIHGVTPGYIRELADAGYHGIPVEKLIEMRIHGISAEMLERRH